MLLLLPILADDSDIGKVVIGIIVAIVWGIGAMVSNYKKATAKTGAKSWQQVLKELPQNPQNAPGQMRGQLTPTAMATARPSPPRIPAVQPARVVLNRPPAKFAHKPEPIKRRIVPTSSEMADRVSQMSSVTSPRRGPTAAVKPKPNPPAAATTFSTFQAAAVAHQVAGGGSHVAGGAGARVELAGSSTQIAGGDRAPNAATGLDEALAMLRTPANIRTQFILAEILRTPVALRQDE